MKRSKSSAQKRKEAATARDAVAKLPKMTDFFKITEQSRPGTSTERDEENYSVQEKEDYDDQHQSDCYLYKLVFIAYKEILLNKD